MSRQHGLKKSVITYGKYYKISYENIEMFNKNKKITMIKTDLSEKLISLAFNYTRKSLTVNQRLLNMK